MQYDFNLRQPSKNKSAKKKYFTINIIQGGVQNFLDWCCKNRKTHHKAYQPPPPSEVIPSCM